MKHLYKSTIVCILLIVSLFPLVTVTKDHTSFSVDVDGESSFSDLGDVQEKIDPFIQTREWNDLVEVIIHYREGFELPDNIKGYPVNYKYSLLNNIQVNLPMSLIQKLSIDEDIDYIEYNHKYEGFLLDSTKQLGLPASFWKTGNQTANGMSIAVIDSGMDMSHVGLADRIIASYNAIDDNATNAIDEIGHGTHVAGIAAGYLPFDGNYSETQRGNVPPACSNDGSCPLSLGHQLENMDFSKPIRIQLDWAAKGTDTPNSDVGYVIFNPNTRSVACDAEKQIPHDCFFFSSSGKIDKTITLPKKGEYFIGILNQGGGEGQFFESSITYTRSDIESDTSAIKGVAYGANLINIKVLDGLSGGELSTFERAVDFVINNREKYNISVVNLSLGLNVSSPTLDALIGKLADNGILSVAAAGNSGLDSGGIYSPASAPEALTVGAINRIGEITFYSNVGSQTTNGASSKPDVLAPGGSFASQALEFETDYDLGFGMINSLDAKVGFNLANNDLIGYQGTSMASPHIAGLASLIAGDFLISDGWDWNSRESVMKVKRAILSGTYEVANIGNGREQLPGESNPRYPTVDRNHKDYQEGWGAVDARAVHNLLGEKIEIGFAEVLNFDLQDPEGQKTYSYPMTLSSGINYGFLVDVPTGADIDIKVVDSSYRGSDDDGDLTVLASTNKLQGVDEGIGLMVENTTEVYVMITMVSGESFASVPFEVKEITSLPSVKILSPFEGQEVTVPVTLEFTSTNKVVELFLDGEFIKEISTGYRIFDIGLGEHIIDLRVTDHQGITVSDMVTFVVVADTDNGLLNNHLLLYLISSFGFIMSLRRKFSDEFDF